MPFVSTAVVNPIPLEFCMRASTAPPPSPPGAIDPPPRGPFMGPHGRAGAAGAAAGPAPGRAHIQAQRRGTALPLPNGCVRSGDTGRGEGPWHHKCGPWCEQYTGNAPDAWRSRLGTPLPTALGARRFAVTGPMAEVPAAETGPKGPSLLVLVHGLWIRGLDLRLREPLW